MLLVSRSVRVLFWALMLLAIVMFLAMHLRRSSKARSQSKSTTENLYLGQPGLLGHFTNHLCKSNSVSDSRFIFGVTLMQLAYAHLKSEDGSGAVDVAKYYGSLGSASAVGQTTLTRSHKGEQQ